MKIDREKLEAIAKPGHSTCCGIGIIGYTPGTTNAIICPCVRRALRRKGIRTAKELQQAIGVEDPPEVHSDREGTT